MTPAPASVSLPPRQYRDRPKQAPRATVEAPAQTHQVDIELLLARVTIKGVAGVSSSAVAEYVAILQRDLASAARLHRLNAPTLPAPACIDDALATACEVAPSLPPAELLTCLQCHAPATHESFAVGFSTEWAPLCERCADETEENQRDVYDHEMSQFGGAYGLPDVRVRRIASTPMPDDGDAPHDPSCADPCCVPEDEDDFANYCADEGHQVLTSGAAYYGVAGQW